MRRTLQVAFVVAVSVLVLSVPALALDQTPTGFYYPLGRNWWSHGCGDWLERDSANGGCYFSGYYHIGEDMMANVDDSVYAISAGTVVKYHASDSSWGTGNVGVFIRHRVSDGSEFLALYGHIRTGKREGDSVGAGEAFATIGPYSGGNHVHFGVVPNTTIPATNAAQQRGWGRMGNQWWADANGFVDPVNWITTRTPWSDCTPANVWWTWTPTENRWYRSNEHLTYATSGSDVQVQTSAMYLADAGLGWHDYWAHAWNGCGDVTVHWAGGWDNQGPSASRSGGAAPGVWNSGQTVSWSASDAHSGVKRQWYRWNGGGWAESGGPASLSEGKNTLEVQVEDSAWNGGSQDGNVAVVNLGQYWLDTTPPTTTALLSPASPNGQNGWYVTNPSVTLSATDPNGANGSGVARTDYSIDSGAAVRYTGAFVVAGDGSHVVRFWSTDVAGNVEAQKSIAVAVDSAPPVVTGIDDGEESASTDTLSASWEADDAASGVCEYEYAIGSTHCGEDIVTWTATDSPYAYRQNLNLEVFKTYYFKVRATDCAGHVSAVLCSDGVMVVPKLGLIGIPDAGGVSAEVRASDNYLISDALGQFVVGTSASAGYAMNHGYWCGGIEVLEPATLAEARSLPDDSRVRIAFPIPVTAGTDRFLNRFYIEPATRVGGLLVRHVPGSGPGVSAGDAVTVVGKMATVGGERCLDLATVESASTGPACPAPVGMVGKDIGGIGVYNIGLLVRTCGWVTYKSADGSCFYIEDGSNTWDGSGHYGLRVALSSLAPGNAIVLPSGFEGRFVTVTGIISVAMVTGQAVPCVRPREQGDVAVVF